MSNIRHGNLIESNKINGNLFDMKEINEAHKKFDLEGIEKTKETIETFYSCLEFGSDADLTASYLFLRKRLRNQMKAFDEKYGMRLNNQ